MRWATTVPAMLTIIISTGVAGWIWIPPSRPKIADSARASSTPVAKSTVTWQRAVRPPLMAVAMMVAWPTLTAVTLPLASTVATDGSVLVHFTPPAAAGSTVAINV